MKRQRSFTRKVQRPKAQGTMYRKHLMEKLGSKAAKRNQPRSKKETAKALSHFCFGRDGWAQKSERLLHGTKREGICVNEHFLVLAGQAEPSQGVASSPRTMQFWGCVLLHKAR